MAYDPELLARLRRISARAFPALEEKSMFGGYGFFVAGNYAFGAGPQLVVRVGPEQYADALSQPHAREMDITGRPMRGWVFVDSPGVEQDEALQRWMEKGVAFASTLPAK